MTISRSTVRGNGNGTRAARSSRREGISVALALAALVLSTVSAPLWSSSPPPFSTASREKKCAKTKPGKLTSMVDIPSIGVYYGGLMIAAGDTLGGPVLVIKGSLDIQNGGVLSGDAWVINGDVILSGSAEITGMANIVNGSDYLSHNARVVGGIRYYCCECRLDDAVYEDSGKVVFVREEDPRAVRIRPALRPGGPTRVDYEIARVGFTRENDRHRKPYTKAYGFLNVPLWKDSGGFLGFDVAVSIPVRGDGLRLLLNGFKRTESNDIWQIGRLENGFIVTMSGDDYLDYWERRGGEVGLAWKVSGYSRVTGSVSYQEDVSLSAMKIPCLLRSTGRYRENPGIDEGERLAIALSYVYDGRDEEDWRRNAWRFDLEYEKGLKAAGADFSYDAFGIDARRYQYFGGTYRVNLRGRLFSAFNRLPGQLKRTLGGYAGVRGARDIPFPVEKGDRMALFSIEARRRLPDLWGIRYIFSSWDILVFSDIGLLADAEDESSPFGFLDARWEEWIKTVGLGISGQSFLPYIGLYVAQDLGRDVFEPRVILRFEESF